MCRIKVVKLNDKDKFSKLIFDKQRFFSFSWICIFICFVVLIHPDTFLQAISSSKELSKIQKTFFAIPGTLSLLVLTFEIFLVFTNLKSTKIGLNDKLSSTYTVWINKYEFINDENEENKNVIQPKSRTLPTIKIE